MAGAEKHGSDLDAFYNALEERNALFDFLETLKASCGSREDKKPES